MIKTWSWSQIDVVDLIDKIRNSTISIPSFQRGVVWSNKDQNLLIDSIKKGYPFGSILIHREGEKLQLIDGLQRSVTLYTYLENPSNFFNKSDIHDNELENLIRLIGVQNSKNIVENLTIKITDTIIGWVRENHTNNEDVKHIQYYALYDVLVKEFPTLEQSKSQTLQILEQVIIRYKNNVEELNNKKVPVIYYDGMAEDLPIVFERINQQGTKLNKYQIYAATWTKRKFKISSKELGEFVLLVAERYEQLGNSTDNIKVIEVDNFNRSEFINKNELNTFELSYALGKYLIRKFPNLFRDNNEVNKIDSLGFNLITSCLLNPISKMSNLDDLLHEKIGSNIEKFVFGIIESVKVVNKIISPFTIFKANKRNNTPNITHTELQITSMISSYFLKKYGVVKWDEYHEEVLNIDYDYNINRKQFKEEEKKFINNAIKKYLIDILNNVWSGTGDSTLNKMVLNFSNYYFEDMPKLEFENSLQAWYSNNRRRISQREKFTNATKIDLLLLNIIYLDEFTAREHLDFSKYDIEHLLPKKTMRTLLSKFKDIKIAGSSIGNLCLLPEEKNRSKKDLIIYDYIKDGELLKEYESKFTFTTRDDFKWIDYNFINGQELKKYFDDYIDTRFKKRLLPKIVDSIYTIK